MSTSSSLPYDPPHGAVPSWKKEVNERLAAHRTRHAKQENGQTALPIEPSSRQAESRAQRVAARVAARYANAPSYSELLAQEALNAARAASAAADAAREAHAAAQAILQGLDLHPEQPIVREPIPVAEVQRPPASSSLPELPMPRMEYSATQAFQPAPPPIPETPAIPFADIPKTVLPPADFVPRQTAPEAMARPSVEREPEAPVVAPPEALFVEPAEPIPGNLIEFPRTLVASQKARPRIAEGPLRDKKQAEEEAAKSQLSIFEVETEQVAPVEKELVVPTKSTAEWSSIELDAQPAPAARPAAGVSSSILDELPLSTAKLEDRLMSGLVDMCLVSLGFLAFVASFVACTPHLPTGKGALVAVALTWIAFHLIYQYLFFTFAEGTPGMRYAHIALCTFDDENPTREQMRKRIPTTLLSLAPMGLGILWALFDEDHLSWHDRLTKTYQRSYR